jgi:hypothetical protein
MKYDDGTGVHVGDRVRIANGDRGVVVASIESGEYSAGFSKEEWDYLEGGIVVLTDRGALVHFEDPLSTGMLTRD